MVETAVNLGVAAGLFLALRYLGYRVTAVRPAGKPTPAGVRESGSR
jgi:hypothetical protein